jgi:trehalose 6-phosphate phosphatase
LRIYGTSPEITGFPLWSIAEPMRRNGLSRAGMHMSAEHHPPPEVDPARSALFVDFDGTLVELARTPDAIEVPERLEPLLTRLMVRLDGALAIVSGRALSDLEHFLPAFPGTLVGSHGAERRGVDDLPPPGDLVALHGELRRIAAAEGLLAEIKPLGGALHFRTAPDRADAAYRAAKGLAAAFPAYVIQDAKMAVELKPRNATKAVAVAALMEEESFSARQPIYLGDDATDEPAMREVVSRGGFAVKVGEGDSAAAHRLASPPAVLEWLETIAGADN